MGTVIPHSAVVEVRGRRHRVYIGGTGAPTVVFEPALGDVGLTWGVVQPVVGAVATTVGRDRPGLGGSQPSAEPRTAVHMVRELRSVLAATSSSPPFVLVGHSSASLTVQAFARMHPGEVAALVLVDGAHEDQMARFPPELDPTSMLAAFALQLRQMAESAEGGEHVPPLVAPPSGFPPELAAAYAEATLPTAGRLRAIAAEYEGISESQAHLREYARSEPMPLPLIALRHGVAQPMPGVDDTINERYEAVWRGLQDELAARSTSGTVVVVEGAGHNIHHDRPAAVVAAIEDAIRRAAGSRRG